MQIAVEKDDEGEIFKTLVEALIAFNREAAGVGRGEPVVVTLRDDHGFLRGGVWGRVNGDSAYFDIVFLDEPLRGRGRGRAMMAAAEAEARRRGARDVWLYTLSWQARPFYEKLGYRCFAELPFMGGKHRRLFMAKEL
ncbi:MAG TPA: GNAT family N-acetyltransferase [Hyphomicrobiales bacterium]|nr:GNAT family N-acetyltransferase [Hyphomicrobiales bacterium]